MGTERSAGRADRRKPRAGVGRGPLDPKRRQAAAKGAPAEEPAEAVVPGPVEPFEWHGGDALRPFLVPLSDMAMDPGNVRRHPERNLDQIRASLVAFGQHRLAVAQRRGDGSLVVRVGNGMLEAARSLGWTHLAVHAIEEDDARATARAIADNRAGESAEWREVALAEALADLAKVDASLPSVVGFSGEELARLSAATGLEIPGAALPSREAFPGDASSAPSTLSTPRVDGGQEKQTPETASSPATEDPPIAPPPATPVSEVGDLWRIGPHRLLVGDSTRDEDVDRLLAGDRVRLVVTDPPYAIYGSSTGIGSDIADDKMVRPFFERIFRQVERVLAVFCDAYVFTDWRSYAAVWDSAHRTTLKIRNALVWDKGNGGMGAGYANCYELVAFLTRKPVAKAMQSHEKAGLRPVMRPNIIRCSRAHGEDRQHNAAKPIAVLSELINNSSEEGQAVLDLFAGSASTAIAAHRLKRRAFLMEITPRFADVSIRRLSKEVGMEPIHVESGKTYADVARERGVPV